MEIDVTELIETDTWEYAGSRATHGENAAKKTWEAAQHAPLIINTPEKQAAVQRYAQAIGFSEDDDVLNWTPEEINALAVQIVTLGSREFFNALHGGFTSFRDYARNFGGLFYRGIDRRWYYYFGE